MKDKTFIQWLREPVDDVKPIPVLTGLVIGIGLAILDFFIPFVLVIAGFIFIKTGHRKMGIFLVVLNLLPDSLPCVDEVIGTAIDFSSLWKKYKKAIDIADKASNAISTVQKKLPDYKNKSR